MHIGILFYSETIALESQSGSVNGRSIANNNFLKKLILHKNYHRITLFVASRIEKDFVTDFLGDLALQVTLVSFIDMESYLKKNTLDILHIPGPDLYRALHIRNIFKQTFAVTGLTHTLGHQPSLEWLILSHNQNPQPCDRLICTSPTAQVVYDRMTKILPTHLKTEIIPLGIDPSPLAHTYSLRPQLKFSDTTPILLSLGRLSRLTKADLMPLLILFSKISKARNDAVFILAGSAGQEGYDRFLKEEASKMNLTQLHILPNPDEALKWNLYKTADIFLAINDNPQETFGLSILEASASGLPVIASDWNGYKSLISEGTDGFLIPTWILQAHEASDNIAPIQIDSLNHLYFSQATASDLDIFYEKTMNLIENPIRRMEMGLAAREKADQYTWEKVIPHYFQLWEKLGKAEAAKQFQFFDYHKIFYHYATQTLSLQDAFVINQTGLRALETKNLLRAPLAEEILNIPLLFEIMTLLKEPLNLSTLSTLLKTSESIDYHLLWLFKYGYISHQEKLS